MLDQQLHTDRYMSSPSQSDPPHASVEFSADRTPSLHALCLRKAMGAAVASVRLMERTAGLDEDRPKPRGHAKRVGEDQGA